MSDPIQFGDPGYRGPRFFSSPDTDNRPTPVENIQLRNITEYGDPGYQAPSIRRRESDINRLLPLAGENPEEHAAKLGSSLYLANRLGVQPEAVYRDFEWYAEEFLGQPATPQRVSTAIANSFRRQSVMMDVARLRARQMAGDSSPEVQAEIDALKADLPPEDQTDRNWIMNAVTRTGVATASIIPFMAEGFGAGFAGAAAGGAAGIPFGPAMATLGATIGGAGAMTANSAILSAGLAYDSLLEMRDVNGRRIDGRAAWLGAASIGMVSGVLETVGGALVPGVDDLLQRGLNVAIRRTVLSDRATTAIGAFGARLVQGTVEETGVELAQELVNIVGEEWAKAVTNDRSGSQFQTDAQEIIDRVVNTAIDSVLGMGVVSLPGSAWAGAKTYRATQAQDAQQDAEAPEIPRVAAEAQNTADIPVEEWEQSLREREAAANERLAVDPDRAAIELLAIENEWQELERERANTATPDVGTDPSDRPAWTMTKAEYETENPPFTPRYWSQTPEAQAFKDGIRERGVNYSDAEIDAVMFLEEIAAAESGLDPTESLRFAFGDRPIRQPDFRRWADQVQKNHPDLTREQAELFARERINGAHRIEDGRYIIELSDNANESTLIHEVGHALRRRLTPDSIMELSGLYQVPVEEIVAGNTGFEEQFARDWEEYWRTGQAPTEAHRSIFERLAQILRRVYEAVVPGSAMTPEKRAFFDRLVERTPLEPQDIADQGGGFVTADPYQVQDQEQTVAAGDSQFPVVEIPVEDIVQGDQVQQFKAGADESGVVEPLESARYERLGTAPIVVWERNDGTREVITGRHRLDLARRTGESTIPGQIVRESDGFTRDQALRFDAESNIRDGQGSVADYARYFRSAAEIDENAARNAGLMSRAAGRQGFSIGRYAGESLYSLYANGEIGAGRAAAIAAAAPGNDAAQRAGIERRRDMNAEELFNYVRFAATMQDESASQVDMFGTDDVAMAQMERLARSAAQATRAIKDEIGVLRKARNLSTEKAREALANVLGDGAALVDTEEQHAAINRRLTVLNYALERMANVSQDPEVMEWLRGGMDGENPALTLPETFEESSDQETLFQISAWHGSPHLFDQFSLEAIGTGEGNQAFGWGLYFSGVEGVARDYATNLSSGPDPNTREGTRIHAPFWDTEYYERTNEGWVSDGGLLEPDSIEAAAMDVLAGREPAEEWEGRLEEIRQFIDAEQLKIIGNRQLYRVTLNPESSDKWLEWRETAPRELRERVAAMLPDTSYKKMPLIAKYQPGMEPTGERVYRALVEALGSPREASRWLNDDGYTGIKYPVQGATRTDYSKGENYVVFDADRIRIDETILFQYAGENAAVTEEQTENLAQARQMEERGDHAEMIRRATGWFRGRYDRKWRFELPTQDMKFRPDWEAVGHTFNGPLSQLLDAEPLFTAYPILRNLSVRTRMALDADAKGVMEADRGLFMEIMDDPINDIRSGAITVYAQADTPDRLKTILAHEIQHVIQEIEGFAKGDSMTSPRAEYRDMVGYQRAREQFRAQLEAMSPEFQDAYRTYQAQKFDSESHEAEFLNQYGRDQYELRLEVKRDAFDVMLSSSTPEALSAFSQAESRMSFERYRFKQMSDRRRYAVSAGEIEARDIMARMGMTSAERADIAPYSSADDSMIRDDEVTVLFQEDWGPDLTAEVGEGRVTAAIETLLKKQSGFVQNVVDHPVLGPITLVYGSAGKPKTVQGYGLSHIIRRRTEHGLDGTAFVRTELPALLKSGVAYSKLWNNGEYRPHIDRVYLGIPGAEAAIRLDWDQNAHTWVVSAFPTDKKSVNETAWGSVVGDLPGNKPAPTVDATSMITPYSPAGNTLFQSDLAAYHGTDAEKLSNALDLGGMPMPSIAIRPAAFGYDDFGNITLIGDRNMIDPEIDFANEVYSRDAYTARYPDVKWKPEKGALWGLYEKLETISKSEIGKLQNGIAPGYAGEINDATTPEKLRDILWSNASMQVVWLREEKGIEYQIPTERRTVPEDRLEHDRLQREYRQKWGDDMDAAIAAKDMARLNEIGEFHDWARTELGIDIPMETIDEFDSSAHRKNFAQYQNEYSTWLADYARGFFSDPQVKGKRYWMPVTLDSLVQAMSKGKRVGAEETMTYGPGRVRAMASEQIPSIDEMHNRESELTTNEQSESHWEENVKPVVDAYIEASRPAYKYNDRWSFLDDAHKALGTYLKGGFKRKSEGRMAKALRSVDITPSPDIVGLALTAAHAIVDAPVKYFEAKPRRPIMMNEWRAAVIPSNTSETIKERLRDHGIALYEYDGKDAKQDTLARAIADQPDVLFQEGDGETSAHEAEVEGAVRRGLYVPYDVLKDYATRPWAIEEIERRQSARAEARAFRNPDEFVEYMLATDMNPRSAEYYREVYDDAPRRSLAEENARWTASLDRHTVQTYLLTAVEKEAIDQLPHETLRNVAYKLQSGKQLRDSEIDSVIRQLKRTPGDYRRLFAEIAADDEALLALDEEITLDPDTAEIEQLRIDRRTLSEQIDIGPLDAETIETQLSRHKEWLKAQEEGVKRALAGVRRAEAELNAAQQRLGAGGEAEQSPWSEAVRAAKAQSRKVALEKRRTQLAQARESIANVRQQMRALYRYRENVQRQIKRIMRKPASTIDYEYAKQIEEIQAGLRVGSVSEKRRQQLQDVVNDIGNEEVKRIVTLELERHDLKKMTAEELDAIETQIRELWDKGREARIEKLDKEKLIRRDARNAIIAGITRGQGLENLQAYGSRETTKELKRGRIHKAFLNSWRPERLWRAMGGGENGALYQWLWKEINQATDAELRAADQRISDGEAAMKRLGVTPKRLGEIINIGDHSYTRDEVIHMYIAMQDRDSAAALQHGNRIPLRVINQYIAKLSREDKAWGDWMVDSFGQDNFDRIQEVLIDTENRGMAKVARYFPMLRKDFNYRDWKEEVADSILRRTWAGKAGVNKRFTLQRQKISPRNQRAIRLGATAIWRDQVQKQEKYIASASLVQRLRSIFGHREVQQAVTQEFGTPALEVIDKYINDFTNPNIYRAQDGFSRGMQILRNNYAVAVLAYNAKTVLKQLPSSVLYLAEVDPWHLAAGWAQMMAHPIETMRFVEQRDPQVKARTMNRYMEEIKLADKNRYQKIVAKVGQTGFLGIAAADKLAVTVGWKAVYDARIAAGASEQEAIEAAQTATARTQPAGRAKDLAAIYRSDKGFAWFLMFSNQLNQIFNLTTYDLYDSVKRGKAAAAFGIVSGVTMNAVAMGVISRMRLWDDDAEPDDRAKQVRDDLLLQLLSAVPVFGGPIVSGVQGWHFARGVDPFPFAYEIGAVGRALTDGDLDIGDVKSVIRLMEAGGTAAGLPVVAARRARRSVLDDDLEWDAFDPWELVGGRPDE